MPKVKINKNSPLKALETFQKVSEMFEGDAQLKKLDPGYECDFNEGTLSGTAKGKQFTANLNVKESGDTSTVEIVVDLPFHLALAKPIVEKTLTQKLEDTLS